MADPYGEKREAIEILLARGWSDDRIAAEVPCSRTWVVGVRKELGVEPRGRALPLRDRIEQAIARGLDDATIAVDLATEAERVAKVRADMLACRPAERIGKAGDRRAAERHRAYRAAGRCVRCGDPSPDQTRCVACRAQQRAADRIRRARLADAGLCLDCRAGLAAIEGWAHVRCPECHERNREATAKYNNTRQGRAAARRRMAATYQRRRAAKLCTRCEAPCPDRAVCEACAPTVKVTRIRYLDRQEARC